VTPNEFAWYGDNQVSPAGRRVVLLNLQPTGRVLHRPAWMPVGGQL
jgi:hypothetical protein